jgi:hypothetical protein
LLPVPLLLSILMAKSTTPVANDGNIIRLLTPANLKEEIVVVSTAKDCQSVSVLPILTVRTAYYSPHGTSQLRRASSIFSCCCLVNVHKRLPSLKSRIADRSITPREWETLAVYCLIINNKKLRCMYHALCSTVL